MNSASLCSLAGRYDNPIPTGFLAPLDCLKIPGFGSFYFPNYKCFFLLFASTQLASSHTSSKTQLNLWKFLN
jgi:hypothetical protein